MFNDLPYYKKAKHITAYLTMLTIIIGFIWGGTVLFDQARTAFMSQTNYNRNIEHNQRQIMDSISGISQRQIELEFQFMIFQQRNYDLIDNFDKLNDSYMTHLKLVRDNNAELIRYLQVITSDIKKNLRPDDHKLPTYGYPDETERSPSAPDEGNNAKE